MTIEQMVEAVVKRITVSDLGDTKLHPEKAARLIREIEKSTPMLQAARRLNMTSDKRDIDRVGFHSRIMGPAPAEGELMATDVEPTFTSNQLSVVKAVAVVELSDEALEDNIEREDFEDTLIALMGERAGVDMEELFINGDTSLDATDPYLDLIDGWLKLAGQQLTGVLDADFDDVDVESMFEAMLVKLMTSAPNFMRRRNDLTIWTSWLAENAYREALRERGTALGDQAQTSNQPLSYKGIPVVGVPNMPAGDALLTVDSNLVYGIRRDIRLEPDRLPRYGRTDFIITFRVDADYEDESGAVHATGFVGA